MRRNDLRRVKVSLACMPGCEDLGVPQYGSDGASGVDLRAAVREVMALNPGSIHAVPTGLCLAIPTGWEAQVRSRSGLALKGVIVANSPGTIDSDYRGEIAVVLANISGSPFLLHRGCRIAQMVFSTVSRVDWKLVSRLPGTKRGARGFGSTGTS